MPQKQNVNFDIGEAWYIYSGIVDLASNRDLFVTITNEDNGSTYVIQVTNAIQKVYNFWAHPSLIEFSVAMAAGSMQYLITDAAGNPSCEEYSIKFDYGTSGGSITRGGPPKQIYRIKRDEQCGGKNVTTFVFRNMRGGVDWFLATGREEKSVAITGTTFNRHTYYNRNAGKAFGVLPGQHSTTNLWNDREDTISVFSQPLTNDQAIWLEELLVSPEVWVVKPVDNSAEDAGMALQQCLQAVIIQKGSYNIYSTEDNVNYIDFKYTLSEHTITQKN